MGAKLRSLARRGLPGLVLLLAQAVSAAVPLEPCELTGSHGAARVSARCATVTVAEDPARPDGPQIELFVARIPALTPDPAADAVTIINGGPGASSVDLYVDLQPAFAGLRRERDIVLVDQRGTGRSHALLCPELERAVDGYAPEPIRKATRDCLDGLAADPRFYTTSVAVQDLERVRRTLGYTQWNLYGVSYGTRVAQHYLRRFPASVRTLTLDGVVPPQAALGPDIALNAQAALDAVLERCEQDTDCAGAFPELRRQLAQLGEQLRAAPVPLQPANPVTGRIEPFSLTYPHLASTLRLLSYAPETVSLIPLIVSEAFQRQNYVPLASHAIRIEAELAGAIAFGMHNSVACTEDVPFFSAGEIPWQDLDATFLGSDQVRALQTICELWPAGPIDEDFKAPLTSAVPTLLLSGEADPITPPAYAERAALGLGNSLHVIAPGQGHGVVARGCIPLLLSDFVEQAGIADLDTGCVERLRPSPFFVDLLGPTP